MDAMKALETSVMRVEKKTAEEFIGDQQRVHLLTLKKIKNECGLMEETKCFCCFKKSEPVNDTT